MTTIGYIFLDANRDELIPLEQQRLELQTYATELRLSFDELLVEQSYSPAIPLLERTEGKRMVSNAQPLDTIIVMKASWVLGNPKVALSLLEKLKEKEVSLFCIDLEGNISMPTQTKLLRSQGISSMVYKLCNALSLGGSGGHGAAIRAGKARQKMEGKYLGGPVPFGWMVGEDGKLQQDMQQQDLIAEMIRLKADRWSYRDIAKKMQEEQGLNLSHEGIRRILIKNPKPVSTLSPDF